MPPEHFIHGADPSHAPSLNCVDVADTPHPAQLLPLVHAPHRTFPLMSPRCGMFALILRLPSSLIIDFVLILLAVGGPTFLSSYLSRALSHAKALTRMLDPQGDLSHRDENHSLDYSLYIPSHSTHASPEHERKAENSLNPPLTAASSIRSRMEGHGTPVSGLRSIGLGSASRQHCSHAERTEASSRPQRSNPMHQIDIGRLPLLGASSMVVIPGL